ncbi:MAG: hypothetical protein ACD_78C00048G0003 [uncultured bacterium (gcode 4)]|uniref:Uncharacterized protein n=1 Tax=uncultured bacterium (gcode 4) TaxID=1234023 RepID=K1YYF4_9BACT|nr:MAG: hypothetical protein ACD_78C00048G0003 [uncultured bacterium (gcode 4)]
MEFLESFHQNISEQSQKLSGETIEKWLILWKYTDEFYTRKQALGSGVCNFVLM